MCKININEEKNGIELKFESKPEQATIEAIKAHGFRWSRGGGLWWAKQTPERLTFAASLGELEQTATKDSKTAEHINMDGITSKNKNAYGAEFAKIIREELKNRGVKNVTVRAKKSGYTDSIIITVKATPADFVSVEEYKERYTFCEFACDVLTHGRYTGEKWIYSAEWETLTEEQQTTHYNNFVLYEIAHRHEFNEYHRERKNYPQYTTAFCNKLDNIFVIANQWNWDKSDYMSDYFDIGYYLDIDIKTPEEITPRETMTDEERNELNAEREREEAERKAAAAETMRRLEEERKQANEYETRRKEAQEKIYDNIFIEDLEETEQIFIDGLKGCGGKENSIKELEENTPREANAALITRKIIMSNDIYNLFGDYLLCDWDFVAGKGGTSTEDNRINNINEYGRLTAEQRESITFYNSDCIGVYVDNDLKMVIDPQGYNYCRYCYLATEETTTEPAAAALERLREEAETKPAFYFPADVKEQCNALKEGQRITIYQCDGWNLASVDGGSGIVTGYYCGTYAQYSGVWIELLNGRKENKVFIHNGRKCLIYEGIKEKLPASITCEAVSNNMYMLYNSDQLLNNILDYYGKQGEKPIIDTIQR